MRKNKIKKNHQKRRIVIGGLAALFLALLFLLDRFGFLPEKTFPAEHFHLSFQKSNSDFNQNGKDDYLDLLEGAKRDARNHPKYDGSYYSSTYPPDNIGVCTDLVWRAFREAGLSLRDMVDQDVQRHPEAYPTIQVRDPNIDFRRVKNLRIFFSRYGKALSTDIHDLGAWQSGDIVIFRGDKHIGIISNLRNAKGRAFLLHNGGQPKREEDYFKRDLPTEHFRVDFQKLKEADLLIPF